MSEKVAIQIDRYEPNYRQKCGSCEQSPTVTALAKDGSKHEMHLCGPCCFGEAACIDPNVWNEPVE